MFLCRVICRCKNLPDVHSILIKIEEAGEEPIVGGLATDPDRCIRVPWPEYELEGESCGILDVLVLVLLVLRAAKPTAVPLGAKPVAIIGSCGMEAWLFLSVDPDLSLLLHWLAALETG